MYSGQRSSFIVTEIFSDFKYIVLLANVNCQIVFRQKGQKKVVSFFFFEKHCFVEGFYPFFFPQPVDHGGISCVVSVKKR